MPGFQPFLAIHAPAHPGKRSSPGLGYGFVTILAMCQTLPYGKLTSNPFDRIIDIGVHLFLYSSVARPTYCHTLLLSTGFQAAAFHFPMI